MSFALSRFRESAVAVGLCGGNDFQVVVHIRFLFWGSRIFLSQLVDRSETKQHLTMCIEKVCSLLEAKPAPFWERTSDYQTNLACMSPQWDGVSTLALEAVGPDLNGPLKGVWVLEKEQWWCEQPTSQGWLRKKCWLRIDADASLRWAKAGSNLWAGLNLCWRSRVGKKLHTSPWPRNKPSGSRSLLRLWNKAWITWVCEKSKQTLLKETKGGVGTNHNLVSVMHSFTHQDWRQTHTKRDKVT